MKTKALFALFLLLNLALMSSGCQKPVDPAVKEASAEATVTIEISTTTKDNTITKAIPTTEPYLSERLARRNEEIIFSIAIDNSRRYATLCADKNSAYIVFRLGTVKTVEAEVIDYLGERKDIFNYSHYSRGWYALNPELAMQLNHFCFEDEDRIYHIFDCWCGEDDIHALGIATKDQMSGATEIHYAVDGSLIGSLLPIGYGVLEPWGQFPSQGVSVLEEDTGPYPRPERGYQE